MNSVIINNSGLRPWYTQYCVWFNNNAGRILYIKHFDGKFYTFTTDPLYAMHYSNIRTAEKRLTDIRNYMKGMYANV